MKPLYLEKIKSLAEAGMLTLAGNRILIELLEEGEQTTKGGIITNVAPARLRHDSGDRARVAVVLATGPGYVTDDGENVDMTYKAGDYVLINQFGAKTFGAFFGLAEYKADSIGLITDELVQGRISDFTAFQNILRG
jgi:co-chaperonin GroES (HSP10)